MNGNTMWKLEGEDYESHLYKLVYVVIFDRFFCTDTDTYNKGKSNES